MPIDQPKESKKKTPDQPKKQTTAGSKPAAGQAKAVPVKGKPSAAGTVKKTAAERAQQRAARHEQRRLYASIQPASAAQGEDLQARLAALMDKWTALQHASTLADIHDDLADVDAVLATLPADIEALRTRGYVFQNYLERKVEVLTQQWEQTRTQTLREMERHRQALQRELAQIQPLVQAAQTGGLSQAEAAVAALERNVSAAQSAVEATISALDQNVTQTQAQVEAIEWALDQADQASFDLYPAEDLVAACLAQFLETEKEGPEGVLFLTDERLIFERKEEIATKKILFITTEKEKKQELVFAIPIGQVEGARASQAGFLGHKEMLEILFTGEAPLSQARLRLRRADNEEWAGLIGRVRSGEIGKERTRPKEEGKVEQARQAPTKCPTCGALLTAPVVRGMREITCEYCGAIIRL